MAVNVADKDLSMEYTSVSGVVYVTLDNQLLYVQKFDQHVKLQIVLDDGKGNRDQIQTIKQEKNSMPDYDICEEEDLPVNFASESYNSAGTNEDDKNNPTVTITSSETQEDQIGNEEVKRKQLEGVELVAKASLCKKRMASKRLVMAKKRSNARLVAKEKENSDSDLEMQKEERKTTKTKRPIRITKPRRRKVKLDQEDDIFCPYCSQSFETQRQFRSHQRVERKNFSCEKCKKVFTSQALLLIHMDDHEKKQASGSVNESQANSKSEQSSSDIKSGRKKLKCCICGALMSNFTTLKLHVIAHTGEQEYKCCVCGHLSLSINPHKNHMCKHLKGTQFLCKICNTAFGSRGELATHQMTHKYPCSLCGKEFPNKPTRNYHYRSFHKHDILKCHLCDRLYSSEKALQSHLKRHRNRHEKQCPICGQLFVRLKNHIERVHSNSASSNSSSLFICDKCPKQFPSKNSLNCHLSSAHAAEKPYECPECSKQFASCGKLTRHMKIHLPDKPHVCEICGKACNRSSNLKIHMRTHKRSNSNVNITPENVQQQQMIPNPYYGSNPYYGGIIGNNTMNFVYK